MKHVFFVLIVSVTAFVLGCQDGSMTEPVANFGHQLLKPSPNTGNAVLKGDVVLNLSGTVGEGLVYHVNGLVSYEYKITGEGDLQVYEFSINTQATLIPSNPLLAQGSVDDQSIYQIAAANKQGVIYVQRDYHVPDIGTKFHVVFGIAEDNSFSVQSMWMDQLNLNEDRALSHGRVSSKIPGELIDLTGTVSLDRDATDGTWTIAGQVAYTLTPVPQGITVDISVDGSLTPTYSGNSSPVSGQSSDLVQVPGSQPVVLDKEYVFVDGDGGDDMLLHVRYSVSQVSASLSVDAIWVTPL
jgi:hypothetical protein